MPVNPDLIERDFPPSPVYLVGREKVREFADAVFATAAIHRDVDAARAAGFADVVAPATFATVLQNRTFAQLIAEPDAGIVLSRTIHGEQKFRYARPIVAGDELIAKLRVTGVRSLGANAMVTSETEITDAAGDLVVTATSILFIGDES